MDYYEEVEMLHTDKYISKKTQKVITEDPLTSMDETLGGLV